MKGAPVGALPTACRPYFAGPSQPPRSMVPSSAPRRPGEIAPKTPEAGGEGFVEKPVAVNRPGRRHV